MEILNAYRNVTLANPFLDLEKDSILNFLQYIGCIKIQELRFLAEYYFISLFSLLSLTPTKTNQILSIKFQYNNQLVF